MATLRKYVSKFAIAAAASAFTAVVLSGAMSQASSRVSPAAPTSFSLTLAGTDAHSLDPHLLTQFVPGGGFGVTGDDVPPETPYAYFELSLNLPVGAKVTSFAVSYKYCYTSGTTASAVFGSYSPATLATQQVKTVNLPSTCSHATTTTTGSPIATVAAGRRYVIDFSANRRGTYPGVPNVVLYGSTVKYTCTSPCVP